MAQQDPRLTRLLARHFNDLQGLSTATLATLFGAGAGVWLATGDEAKTFLAGLVIVMLGACAAYGLERFYTGQFGRVAVVRSWMRVGRGFAAVSFVVFLVLTRSQQVTFVCAVLAVQSVWLLIDCWPYRLHEAFVIIATGAAIQLVGWRAAAGPDDIARAIVLVASSMVIAGLADHALLVRGMRTQGGVRQAEVVAHHVSARHD